MEGKIRKTNPRNRNMDETWTKHVRNMDEGIKLVQ